MNVQKTARLLAAIGAIVSLSGTIVHAADSKVTAKASAPIVIVKIGDALLEEYHGGNPEQRTTVIRGAEAAQAIKTKESGKKHS